MRFYLSALGILTLGFWCLEAIFLHDAVRVYLAAQGVEFSLYESSWGDLDPELLLVLVPSLVAGSVTVLVPTAAFATLLYLIVRKFPYRSSHLAVLLCGFSFVILSMGPALVMILTGNWTNEMFVVLADPFVIGTYLGNPLWPKLFLNPLGSQLILIPILTVICIVVGRTAKRSGTTTTAIPSKA